MSLDESFWPEVGVKKTLVNINYPAGFRYLLYPKPSWKENKSLLKWLNPYKVS
jgi:hypothetical protein